MRDTGYRILADGVTVSNDTWATGLANHDLIIGPTGGGKTRGYVLPNLLSYARVVYRHGQQGHPAAAGGRHPGAAWVPVCWSWTLQTCCTRPGATTPCGLSGTTMERECWNEQDIITVAAALVPVEDKTQPFWEYAARNLLEALIGYTLECLPAEEHDLDQCGETICRSGNRCT